MTTTNDALEPSTCRDYAPWVPGDVDGPVFALLPDQARIALGVLWDALAATEAVLVPIYALQAETRAPMREEGIAQAHAILQTVEHQRKQMQDVERRTKMLLDALHDKRTVVVPGLGSLRVNNPPKKRYEGQLLLSRLAARVSDEVFDRESGEIPPLAIICEKVATATAEAVGALTPSFTGWRVGALKEHGIDLKEYEVEERGTFPKIVEVKAKKS